MKTWSQHIVLPVVALLVWGCSDDGTTLTDPETPPTVTYSSDIQPLFTSRCVGCHGLNGSGDLDLRADLSYANLVNVVSPTYTAVRVIPLDPDNSVLFDKISGGTTFGSRMPPGGVLSADDVAMVRTWISEGALDN